MADVTARRRLSGLAPKLWEQPEHHACATCAEHDESLDEAYRKGFAAARSRALDEAIVAVDAARRIHVGSPESGADSVDAAIGAALNDVAAALAALRDRNSREAADPDVR